MITDYRGLTGPAYDDDCNCHCSADRARFQDALDEIHCLLDGQTADTVTDTLLDLVREQVARR